MALASEKDEEEARRKREREGERKRSERKEREGGENAFAYEIKWRIYTVRSQYTYVRPTVNYTVNRRVLFDRRGKEDRARAVPVREDEGCEEARDGAGRKGGRGEVERRRR